MVLEGSLALKNRSVPDEEPLAFAVHPDQSVVSVWVIVRRSELWKVPVGAVVQLCSTDKLTSN